MTGPGHVIDVCPRVGGGRASVLASPRGLVVWREAVRTATARAPIDTMPGPTEVHVTFRLPRPKRHRGARGVRPSAPALPATVADVDRLARAVLSGLVQGGALHAARQVTTLTARKAYADDGAPGATVVLAPDSGGAP